MPHGVHAKTQLNIRLKTSLIARVKDAAKRHGLTQADIVTRGTEAELDRLTAEGDPVLPFARIANALDVARLHARTEDPAWVIDQMVRALTGAGRDGETSEYREFIETMEREAAA